MFFQAEDGIRYLVRSRGLGDVYKRQEELYAVPKHIWDVNNISDKISWQMLDKPNLSDTILSNFANLMKDANKNTDPKYIIGSGTYLLSEFKRNERVVFERNEKFWGGDSAYNFNYPDKIISVSYTHLTLPTSDLV